MKRVQALILIVLISVIEGNVNLDSKTDENWIMARHDSQRSGFSISEAPDTAYLLWQSEIPYTNLNTSPVGTANRIIQSKSGDYLVCFDETGKEVWTSNQGGSIIIVQNRIIVGHGNDLQCLNIENGSSIWEKETVIAAGSPLLTEDSICFASISPAFVYVDSYWARIQDFVRTLLFGCEQCGIACHDILTGERTWIFHEEDISSISYYQGQFLVLLNKGELYSLNKDTREKVWQFKSREKTDGYPALHGNQVVFSGDSHVFCLNTETGALFWKFPVVKGSSPGLAYGKVFVRSHDGYLYCIDEYTGELLWKVTIWHDSPVEFWNELSQSSPVIADGKVFVGSSDKNIYVFDVDNGSLVWKYMLGGAIVASPVIIGDKIFVPSTDGVLYAFGIDPETYTQKAQKYWEQQEYEKSQKYFHKAKEWYTEKGYLQEVALCEEFIETVAGVILKYSLISESLEEADAYFDKGNESLLRKKYDDALESFYRSMQVYERIDHEKGINECLQRIEYIQGISEEEENYSLLICCSLFLVILAFVVIFMLKSLEE